MPLYECVVSLLTCVYVLCVGRVLCARYTVYAVFACLCVHVVDSSQVHMSVCIAFCMRAFVRAVHTNYDNRYD